MASSSLTQIQIQIQIQYPSSCSSIKIKSSIDVVHNFKRNSTLIKALNDPSQPDTINDPVKLALAKAKAYKKKSIQSKSNTNINQNQDPIALDSSKNDGSLSNFAIDVDDSDKNGGLKQGQREISMNKVSEKKEKQRISGIDFVGLGFSDRKQGRGLPPGLVPISDPFPEGDLPEVEIIVGDNSRFDYQRDGKSKTIVEEDSELYKPKVSTWGVFPRPNNISKTYGGGKTIKPGELLETAESKAAKDARTKQLIAAYKRQMGLNIDPKLKSECEKALKEGDMLMDLGKLKEALPLYEKVMDKLIFKSELHGLAGLQWSICQDSLNRSNEARAMYEKLQSHPNVRVSKKARQLMFSFQAMEMMKVTSSTESQRKMGYQGFFEAFIENKNNYPLNQKDDEDEDEDKDELNQAFPYIIFLVSPILMILVIVVQKRLQ